MPRDQMEPQQLRQAQIDLGLSDTDMAAMLGISPTHLRRLKGNPDKGNFRVINETTARLLDTYKAGYRPNDWPSKP